MTRLATNLVSRRQFLVGMAAAAAAIAAPMAPAGAMVETPPAPIPAPPARGWWGYSRDGGEYWIGPFDSREDALAEAQGDDPDEGCTTGWCIPHEMQAPDTREYCVLWLNGHHGTRAFGYGLYDLIAGANEEHDYEGEIGDELEHADFAPLEADLIDVVAVALFRHRRPDLIPSLFLDRLDAPIVLDDLDPLLVALESDAQFEAELTAATEAWFEVQNLKQVPRRLDLESEEHHKALDLGVES